MWVIVHAAQQSYLNMDYSVLEQKARHTIAFLQIKKFSWFHYVLLCNL